MYDKTIGYALCGSFCTYTKAMAALKRLTEIYRRVIPIFSQASWETDSVSVQRKSTSAGQRNSAAPRSAHHRRGRTHRSQEAFGRPGNRAVHRQHLGKTSPRHCRRPRYHGGKSHLRNGRPLLLAVSTNDGLAAAAENIGRLLARKHIYFVPFGQDDPIRKPTSLVANFDLLPDALDAALSGLQLQPVLV